jgi:hypothetical protein
LFLRDAALELKLLAASMCAQQLVTRAVVAPNSHYEPEAAAQFELLAPLVQRAGGLFLYQCALVTDATRGAFEAAAAASAASMNDTAIASLLAFGINDQWPPLNAPPLPPAPADYYLPLLHITPATPVLARFVMYNSRAESNAQERREAFTTAVATGRPAWSDLLFNTVITPGMVAPSNLLVVPALLPTAPPGSRGANATLGTCTLTFDWTSVLKDALPTFVTSVTVVLTSFSGRQATFQLNDGVVSIVGLGDMHAGFDHFKRVATAVVNGEQWLVALYPTQDLMDSFLSKAPMRNAVIIAVVITLCCAVFALYELRRANTMNVLLRRNLAELGRMKAEEAEAQARLMAAGIKQQDQFVSVRVPYARFLRCSVTRDRC